MELGLALTWVGLAATILGTLLGWFAGRRSRQRPDLRSATDFDVILKSEDGVLDRLHMDFDGHKIRSVSRTRIAIWNASGDTVRGSDILPTDRLRLQLDSDDLALHAEIIAASREQIGAKCEIDANDSTAIILSFDFLDASDGFIFELLHMGDAPAKLEGTITGAAVTSRKSGVSLSDDDLDAVAAKWFLRYKYGYAGAVSSLLALVLISFGMPAFQLYQAVSLHANPEIVDVSMFDLSNLSGQQDFAKEVRNGGNYDHFPPFTLAFMVLCTLTGIFALLFVLGGFIRTAIPRSIVLIRPDTSASDGDGQKEALS